MAPPAGQIRPARYLLAFVAIVVVLYALVFLTGNHKATPKLGIDLQGGTRVTLTARTENGQPPGRDQLNQARQIIETRVNGLGVSGAEVVQDGNNLVITVPGTEGDQAKTLGQTAKLRFRKVQQALPGGSPAPATTETPAPTSSGVPPASGETSTPAAPTTQPSPQGRPAPAAQQPAAQQPAAQQQPAPTTTEPAPTSTTAPPATSTSLQPVPALPADPKVAEEIRAAKETRQSSDPNVLQLALATLDCGKPDPLVGNDDPNLPLVSCAQDGTERYILEPAFLDGERIDNATAGANPKGPGYVINLSFDSEGSKTWADFTSANVGQRAAFVLDSKVVSAPTINEAILGGNTEISGQFTQKSATDLANILKYGSLPLSFESSESETVSATLGLASLRAGLIAGGIGLVLVFVYCLFYYRALGILTILSLGLSALVVYAALVLLGRWIGFTLDLAGIAGFIVAIGITADSFVVFFERLKDEIRDGRTFRSAVPRGWVRARRTILSADAVSFLASAVLYLLAVGQVKGFAFTLGMSTVLDLIVVFLVTHPLVILASRSKLLSHPSMSGLGAVQRVAARQRAAGATPAVKEA
ncbi:MAG TPA: protein translocase subunit SecD [Pseudonocardiaceae bacterium]